MSATASPSRTSDTDPAFAAASVLRGIGLIGVLTGLTRSVFGLGRTTKFVLARLTGEGVDPYSHNGGFDFRGVMGLLQRAVLLADALRARLRTPAVAVAMVRHKFAQRRSRIERRAEDEACTADDPLWRIAYVRGDEKIRLKYRRAITGMSDGEIIERICSDLMSASAMLEDTEAAARIAVLAHKAAMLIVPVADQTVADQTAADGAPSDPVAPPRAGRAMADGCAGEPAMAGGQPMPREVGRGPP